MQYLRNRFHRVVLSLLDGIPFGVFRSVRLATLFISTEIILNITDVYPLARLSDFVRNGVFFIDDFLCSMNEQNRPIIVIGRKDYIKYKVARAAFYLANRVISSSGLVGK